MQISEYPGSSLSSHVHLDPLYNVLTQLGLRSKWSHIGTRTVDLGLIYIFLERHSLSAAPSTFKSATDS